MNRSGYDDGCEHLSLYRQSDAERWTRMRAWAEANIVEAGR